MMQDLTTQVKRVIADLREIRRRQEETRRALRDAADTAEHQIEAGGKPRFVVENLISEIRGIAGDV